MDILKKIMGYFSASRPAAQNQRRAIKEAVLFSEIEKRIKENLAERERLREELTGKISGFSGEIAGPFQVLENIDLSGKKEHERVKLIVSENLRLYLSHVNRLKESLVKINCIESREGIEKLFLVLNDFKSSSKASYEKATILIGQEILALRELIIKFSNEMKQIVKNNELFMDDTELCKNLDGLIKENEQINVREKELVDEKKRLEGELDSKNKDRAGIISRISRIRLSDDYKKELEKKQEDEFAAKKIDDKLRSAKQKIDFRELSKRYHFDEKKTREIRNYADNFKAAVINDDNLLIIGFVDEVQGIDIGELKNLKDEMAKRAGKVEFPIEKSIIGLENNLNGIELERNRIEENMNAESKKLKRIISRKSSTFNEIKELSKSLFKDADIV